MHQLLTPAQEIRTDRLLLAPVTPADVDGLRAVLGSSGRPLALVDVQHLVQESIGSRVRHGLGPWTVRFRDDERVVGVGGVTMIDHGVWLLDWQLAAGLDQQDLAVELVHAAVGAAKRASTCAPIATTATPAEDVRHTVLRRTGFTNVHDFTDAAVWADRSLDVDHLAALSDHR